MFGLAAQPGGIGSAVELLEVAPGVDLGAPPSLPYCSALCSSLVASTVSCCACGAGARLAWRQALWAACPLTHAAL